MKALLVLLLVAIASCNTEVQEPELEFDVNGLLKCLSEVSPLVPEVIEIINFVKAADWAQVAIKAVEAIPKIIPAAKGCIAAFKKELNLGGYPELVTNCLDNCLRRYTLTRDILNCKLKCY